MKFIYIALIVNCLIGTYIAGGYGFPAWEDSETWKEKRHVILMTLAFMIFGVLTIVVDLLIHLAKEFWIMLQVKSWISLVRGKFDNLDQDGIQRTLELWKYHKKDKMPFSRLWLKEVARRNGIDLK